jgi:hypothetical protein
MNARKFITVVDFVTVEAPAGHKHQLGSGYTLQPVQKLLADFQHISINGMTCYMSRGSGLQISSRQLAKIINNTTGRNFVKPQPFLRCGSHQ